MNFNAQSIVGLCGSGLTSQCLTWMQQLLDQGVSADRIVVLVRNSGQAQDFLQRLIDIRGQLVGPIRITGFTVFVEQQLQNHWVAVSQLYPTLSATFQPHFLTKDLTQFVLSEAIETCPFHLAAFRDCPLQFYKILDQIVSDSYIAHCSHLPGSVIGEKLAEAWPDRQDLNRQATLKAISCCVDRLRKQALQHNALDFGSSMTLFVEAILTLETFWQPWDYLIVDQVEESPEVFLTFYRQALARGKQVFFSYTIGGGASYTSVSDRIARFLVEETSWRVNPPIPGMGELGLSIVHQLGAELRIPLPPTPNSDRGEQVCSLRAETYLEAVQMMESQIESLLDQGVLPAEIAILIPTFDQVVLQLIQHSPIYDRCSFISPYGSFLRYPIVRGMLTLAQLAHPSWNLCPNREQVAGMLSLCLGIDRVRSTLLTQAFRSGKLHPANTVEMPERIGFTALARYENLRQWLQSYDEVHPTSLAMWWGSAYQQFGQDMNINATDREILKNLLDAARRFHRAFPAYPGSTFIRMLLSGQTPTILRRTDSTGKIIVATPLQFLATGRITSHQFWFDITATAWSKPIWHPLLNHRVLTQKPSGSVFSAELDQKVRKQDLARTLLNLCCRNQSKIYLVSSFTTVRGEENYADLDEQILAATQ